MCRNGGQQVLHRYHYVKSRTVQCTRELGTVDNV